VGGSNKAINELSSEAYVSVNRIVFGKRWKRAMLGIALFSLFITWFFCLPDRLFNTPSSTVIIDVSGQLLAAQIATDGQWRFNSEDSIPTTFERCILTYEDRKFHSHIGIDFGAFIRAFWQNLQNQNIVSGASTISMQTMRMARNKGKRTYGQKCIEIAWALRAEFRYSKEEILKIYCSNAPFGGNVVGLETASWRYYDKPSKELSWAESAALAVLPNAPGMIFPGRNPSEFLRKRNALLLNLKELAMIDIQTYELSLLEPLPSAPIALPRHSLHLLAEAQKNKSGKWIETSIQIEYQREAARIVASRLQELSKNKIFNAAILISNTETGEVLAYVGNGPVSRTNGSANDMIQTPRSSGSILKPFLFGALLESAAITPRTLIPDIPTQYAGFAPKNYDQGFDGAVPAEEALARSLNIPAVRMLKDYGIPLFHKKLKDIGLSTLQFPPSHYGLSLILGGAEVTLWDLVNAYQTVGARLKVPYSQEAVELHFDQDNQRESKAYSYSKSVSWSMLEAMALVNRPEERASWELFGGQQKIAWKTGTSYGFRDAWAVGISPKFTVGVWVGNASGEGRPGITGLNAAAPLLFDVFNVLPTSKWFSAPISHLVKVPLCEQSGMRASKNCGQIVEYEIPEEGLKTTSCTYCYTEHLDKTGQFRVNANCYPQAEILHQSRFELPPLQAWFYKQKTAFYKEKAHWHPNCKNQAEAQAIQLIYPRSHSSIFIPRELNGLREKVVLKAAHIRRDAQIHWHLNHEYLGSTQNFHHMEIQAPEGKYLLTLIDEQGLEHAQWIQITER